MNLRLVILEPKVLANGTHKIRVAISHNSQTRYIPTRFTVPKLLNLKNGVVSGVPNAAYINQQLRTMLNKIYAFFDELEDREYYSCSQLVKLFTNKLDKGSIRTAEEIAGEMLRIKRHNWAEDTIRMHKRRSEMFIEYAGKGFLLSMLDSTMVFGYRDFLRKKGYSETTISMYMNTLRRMVYFALNHGYAKFEVPPFFDYKEPLPIVRDLALSIDQIRQLRDMTDLGKWEECARDIFMLSFYMCGMNIGDIIAQDLTQDFVKFIRIKTKSRRNPNEKTEFSIQPEARAILDKYLNEQGQLQFYGRTSKKSIQHITDEYLGKLATKIGAERLIYYSARKSFAQLANEFMVKDSIIEYCLGDAVSNPRKAIAFYIRANKRMADKAIRKIFDAVASDKPMELLVAEMEL